MYDIAIIVSTICSFLTYEAFGYYSGGVITAGYFAMFIFQPARIAFSLVLAVLICLTAKLIEKYTIFFGRRRFYFLIALSAIISWIINKYLMSAFSLSFDIRIIGHIIPGLIANDMYKQGMFKTIAVLLILSIVVYLCSIVIS